LRPGPGPRATRNMNLCGSGDPCISLAMCMASKASCLMWRKLTNSDFLGSHCSLIWAAGKEVRISPSFPRCERAELCSLCGEASSILLRAGAEGMAIIMGVCACVGLAFRKKVRIWRVGAREHVIMSDSVSVSLKTCSWCPNSLPSWYRVAEAAPTCLPSSRSRFERTPSQ
jgi:hypothetical protein